MDGIKHWQGKVFSMLLRVYQSDSQSIAHRAIIYGLLASFIMPVNLVGDEPQVAIGKDVILHDEGTLRGSVVDEAGLAIGSAEVRILKNARVIASAKADEAGHFSIRSLRNGTHAIQTDGAVQVIRLWGRSAAPPVASENVTVVVRPDSLVRGQAASTPGLLGNPWFIAGVVGVAVGTILIIDDQNDDGNNRRTPRVASP